MSEEENDLLEKSRLVLMGEMMANVSHQWKQPLNTINLAIISARTSNPDKEQLEKYFDIMEDNVNYLASTIDEFLSFFDKKTYSEVKKLSLIVNEIENIVDVHMKNRKITLEFDFCENCGDIFIASSISQVILNFINNAKDAFYHNSKEKRIVLRFRMVEHYLEILCCDNAKGIAKEIQEKIFDPYFTTKENKNGTGIGLYMSKQIVEEVFCGKIAVNSENTPEIIENQKTCFKVHIPFSKHCFMKEDK